MEPEPLVTLGGAGAGAREHAAVREPVEGFFNLLARRLERALERRGAGLELGERLAAAVEGADDEFVRDREVGVVEDLRRQLRAAGVAGLEAEGERRAAPELLPSAGGRVPARESILDRALDIGGVGEAVAHPERERRRD